jgi:hypothetical protein
MNPDGKLPTKQKINEEEEELSILESLGYFV